MSDTILVALIGSGFTLVGTIVTVIMSAITQRKKSKADLADEFASFKAESDKNDSNLRVQISNVADDLKAHIRFQEESDIKQCRVRILRTAADLSNGVKFDREYMGDVLEDIDYYESWCDQHPDYHNHKGQSAIKLIEDYYNNLLRGDTHEQRTMG